MSGGILLSPSQQETFDFIVACVQQVVLPPWVIAYPSAAELRTAGLVACECLRKAGVPAASAEVEVREAGLFVTFSIFEPMGAG